MKLFKRTSITLTLLIIILWIVMFVWVYYPLRRVSVTEVELRQTEQLLEKNNIRVSDELLKKGAHAIAGARVTYLTSDRDAFAHNTLSKDAVRGNNGVYVSGDTSLAFKDSAIHIDGKDGSLDAITADNAVELADSLLQRFNLRNEDATAYCEESDGKFTVTVFPEYKGRCVFDARIKLTLSRDSAFTIDAVPMKFTGGEDSILPNSACAALAEFALSDTENGAEITTVNLGYRVDNGLLKTAWEIRTTEGSTYYVK